MKIGYGKIGRSMPLTLNRCGYLGGDVECVAVIAQLAERHPYDTFYLLGRNSGEDPQSAGLPSNVINLWTSELQQKLRQELNDSGLNHPNLSIEEQQIVLQIFRRLGVIDKFLEMDAHVWWVGQHGTTNTPLPSVQKPGTLTKPHDWSAYYISWVMEGINRWRDGDPFNREEVWLNADPRNYLKMRDLKWPLRHPVITQFDFESNLKHERYGDDREPADVPIDWGWKERGVRFARDPFIWISRVSNTYARLEVNGLGRGTPFGDLLSFNPHWEGRGHFGIFINEARRDVTESRSRRVALRDYVLPLQPDFLHGTWSEKSQQELGVTIKPVEWKDYVPTLQTVRSTLTTPSSGSGWATTKPWEAFAAGTVCFFHPLYDIQGNILRDAPPIIQNYLRVQSPTELQHKVTEIDRDPVLFRELINAQRVHFENNVLIGRPMWLKAVEERIYR